MPYYTLFRPDGSDEMLDTTQANHKSKKMSSILGDKLGAERIQTFSRFRIGRAACTIFTPITEGGLIDKTEGAPNYRLNLLLRVSAHGSNYNGRHISRFGEIMLRGNVIIKTKTPIIVPCDDFDM